MKYVFILIALSSCVYQTDYNSYGVVEKKTFRKGVYTYTIVLDPYTKVKYKTLIDTIIVHSYLSK